MKSISFIMLMAAIVAFQLKSYSQDHHVRIAFLGNSITIGAGTTNPTVDAYPFQAGRLLETIYGDTCIIGNFAVSGRTMLKKGDSPLWNEKQYTDSWNFAPDIVYIMLGTNDSKPQNWDQFGNEFFADYKSMIDSFLVRNPRAKFIVALPPPCYELNDISKVWDIRDGIIKNEIIPLVDSIAEIYNAEVIDFYAMLSDSVHLFPDKVHPNTAGATVMAKMVFDKIVETDIIHEVETGFTYVTGITSNKKIVASGAQATLSWTSINADSIYFEGKKVELNGSMVVSPTSTKTYTAIAYGQKSIDTMNFTLNVYYPELVKLQLSPRNAVIKQTDSVKYSLQFIDQQNNQITNQSFDVKWTITEGSGSFTDKKQGSVVFVSAETGKVVIAVSVGDIATDARITVNELVGIEERTLNKELKIYPNPTKDFLHIEFDTNDLYYSTIKISNLEGKVFYKVQKESVLKNTDNIRIETKHLSKGVYIVEIDNGQQKQYARFVKQ
jgi:acyl-CoA thioesterase I